MELWWPLNSVLLLKQQRQWQQAGTRLAEALQCLNVC
jgi:hypothetical protein